MTNIINFPSTSPQNWLSFEKSIRLFLQKNNIPKVAQEEIIPRMECFFELTALSFQFSFKENTEEDFQSNGLGISEQLTAFTHLLQERTSQLLVERLHLEIDRCALLGLL
jgi:hypothetical protein